VGCGEFLDQTGELGAVTGWCNGRQPDGRQRGAQQPLTVRAELGEAPEGVWLALGRVDRVEDELWLRQHLEGWERSRVGVDLAHQVWLPVGAPVCDQQ
jgi:hypothetical protein